MLVFGGWNGYPRNELWALALASTPDWTALVTPAGLSPTGRYGHCAIHDSPRARMVVVGGYDSNFLGDVWALALAATPAWTQLAPTGTPPAGRESHSAVYDPVRDRLLVFGGYNDSSPYYLNDVWALSLAGTPAWTHLTPAGTPPSARYGHGAIYDPVRDRMVVFGGYYYSSGEHYLSDVWALSLAGTPAWTQLAPTGTAPGARYYHSAIYDPSGDRMLVFGGRDILSIVRNDVWALSLAGTPAWTQLAPTGTLPTARYAHSAVLDPVRGRMMVFGGTDGSLEKNDAWALTLAGTPVWAALAPDATPPGARRMHSAIWDAAGDRMVVFGGYKTCNHDDVWALGGIVPLGVDEPVMQPSLGFLRAPVPTPSRGATSVSYSIAQAGRVRLGIYDASGRLVRRLVDGERPAGKETVVWNGTSESGARLGTGVYFVQLSGPGIRETRKVILLK
jgi:hypothetical protein